MSPAELAFWIRVQRRASGLQPDVRRAILRAFEIVRDALPVGAFEKAIDAGRFEELAAVALSPAILERAFIPVRERMRTTVYDGFRYAVRDLPKAGKIDGTIAVMFDHLSPDVVKAVQSLETNVVTSLQSDIRPVVLTRIKAGLELGQGPRTIARSLREVIGMSPTQAMNAAKRESELRTAGELTDAQIATRMDTYRRQAIALNTETNVKTATLDAFKAGQQLSWQSAIDRGIVDGDRLQKTWVGVLDDRERPEHVAMEGEVVGFDEPFSNGEMIPGESTYNCRCVIRYAVGRAA